MAELDIENFIQTELQKLLPKHLISDGYNWAMFPAGKLFRPNLALSILKDLNSDSFVQFINHKNLNIGYLSAALECHHSYSLVHDDLPSMDNDDFRRGRESTHKKFGEWKAILIGDGLLNISYQFLSKIKLENVNNQQLLLKLFAHSMGPKGLIHGQTLDLSHEMTESFQNTLLTHQLKTARLIQYSLVAGAILAENCNSKKLKEIWRYGESIGILFQLLDDLSELVDEKLTQHELDVNPWLKFKNETNSSTLKRLETLIKQNEKLNLVETKKYLSVYFNKMNQTFKTNKNTIEKHAKIDLIPVMSLLDRL